MYPLIKPDYLPTRNRDVFADTHRPSVGILTVPNFVWVTSQITCYAHDSSISRLGYLSHSLRTVTFMLNILIGSGGLGCWFCCCCCCPKSQPGKISLSSLKFSASEIFIDQWRVEHWTQMFPPVFPLVQCCTGEFRTLEAGAFLHSLFPLYTTPHTSVHAWSLCWSQGHIILSFKVSFWNISILAQSNQQRIRYDEHKGDKRTGRLLFGRHETQYLYFRTAHKDQHQLMGIQNVSSLWVPAASLDLDLSV